MQWIKSYEMEHPELCDRLINGFKTAKELGFSHAGISAKGVDPEWKDSEDVSLNCLPIEIYNGAVRVYREHVMTSMRLYMKEFPVLASSGAKVGFLEPPQIQHYQPGGAFFGEHFEASGLDVAHRVLAFMTNLNSVKKGGGTEFIYQKFVSPAKKGVTNIWPAGFTHTHRGIPAPKEHKYIITGWLSFMST